MHLLQVALDRLGVPWLGVGRILAKLAARPALAEQVPALVQVNLQRVQARTEKRTRLVRVEYDASSFCATRDRAETDEPVYTASSVSKLEPAVEIEIVPLAEGVHLNQIEWPPAFPA